MLRGYSRPLGTGIVLKKVDSVKDIHVMHDWMKTAYLNKTIPSLPQPETLAELYSNITASDFAQPYIVWLHQTNPIFEIEICEAAKDELSSYFISGPHDYTIRLQMPLHIKPAMAMLGLNSCLKHCFNCMYAHQIIAPVLPNNFELKRLLMKTGFTRWQLMQQLPYQIFILNRKKYFTRACYRFKHRRHLIR